MNIPIKLDEVFGNLPRILRYLLPGILIFVLWEFSLPGWDAKSLPEISWGKLLAYAVVFGPTYYGLHRLLFWFVDDWMFERRDIDCWDFFSERYKPDDKKLAAIVGYIEYRWSTIHYCLMTSELGILFSLMSAGTSLIGSVRWQVFGISTAFFVICCWYFIYLSKIELKHFGFLSPSVGADQQQNEEEEEETDS
jgi:hypothetical protein